jgi:peroxiredoxin
MTTPIADEVARMHADAKSRNESENPFTREQAMLAAAGTPSGIASVGSTLPDAQLLDPFGNPTTLSEALDGKAAVIVLYRGAWCPYCNLTLSTYKDQLFPQLLEQDVIVIAISPQAPDGSLTMREKHELPFPVLSDPGNVLARALGVLTQPSEETLGAQRQYGIELTEINADGTVELPMPTVALVDSAATVRWIDVQPDYSVRTEPDEILAAVAEVLR